MARSSNLRVMVLPFPHWTAYSFGPGRHLTEERNQEEVQLESRHQNLEQQKEKQPYETPQLTRHGSVEELTGFPISLSGIPG